MIGFALLFPFFSALSYFVFWSGAEITRPLYVSSKFIQFSFPCVIWFLRGLDKKGIEQRETSLFRVRAISDHSTFRFKFSEIALGVGTGMGLMVLGGAAYFAFLKPMIKTPFVKAAIYEKLVEFGAITPLSYLFLTFLSQWFTHF